MSLNSKKMVRLVLEEGRTIASVNKEYNLGEGTVRSWIRQFEEECEKNLEIKETKDIYEENRRLRKKLEEVEKIKKEPVLIKQLKGIENGRKITKISS